MFLAMMQSEHYLFKAFGLTEDEARHVLFLGFVEHLQSVGATGEAWSLEDYFEDRFDGTPSVETLHEWYGVGVLEVLEGVCYRDGLPIIELDANELAQ